MLQGLREIEAITVLGVVVINEIPGKIPLPIVHKLEVLEPLAKLWRVDYIPSLRLTLPGELASWSPGDEIDLSRKGRKIPIVERAPAPVAQIGEEIFAAAAKIVTAKTNVQTDSQKESHENTQKDSQEKE